MSAPLLYLASKSPRRQALLAQLGLEFETLRLREATGRPRDVVEEAQDAEPPLHYVERIARTKAQVGWQRMQNRKLAERPVLGADTEVVLDGDIFGKPRDADDAIRMLKRLSGRTHQVLTAVAVRHRDTTEVDVCVSRVTLRRLAAVEIDRYTATGEPLDKAGGYAVQGLAGCFVQKLVGSYTNVVGLPLTEVVGMLAAEGFPIHFNWLKMGETELS